MPGWINNSVPALLEVPLAQFVMSVAIASVPGSYFYAVILSLHACLLHSVTVCLASPRPIVVSLPVPLCHWLTTTLWEIEAFETLGATVLCSHPVTASLLA